MRGLGPVATATLGLGILVACESAPSADDEPSHVASSSTAPSTESVPATARHVGSNVCAECHAGPSEAWSGSHHARAMQEPSEQTVLGAFDGRTFEGAVEVFRFERDEKGWVVWVRPRESGAEERPHRVRWTFGFDPLQQLLVDGERGRVQALTVAWDARSAEDGGQRWFELGDAENPPRPGEALHWTGRELTWNFMCAACHSTEVDKGYAFETDEYRTSFAELTVGCEACHGPGSEHVAARRSSGDPAEANAYDPWAEARAWAFAPDAVTASLHVDGRPVAPGEHRSAEIQRCAPCHSRRADLGGVGLDFDQRYAVRTPDEPFYFPDGQAREEVYVHGSFQQSKMGHAGVTCRDCHDPHSGSLRAQGNALCGTCHQADEFDSAEHHFHPAGGEGARCVSCHMPARTFMGVDERRDHRFSVPRPDLTGVPNTCAACHAERMSAQPEWAAEVIAEHHGATRTDGPAERLARARASRRSPNAPDAFASIVEDEAAPPLIRGAALREAMRLDPDRLRTWSAGALRPGPGGAPTLVRRVAAEEAPGLPGGEAPRALATLLKDPNRVVRLTARAGAGPWVDSVTTPALEDEFARSLSGALDRPEGILNAASHYASSDPVQAERLLAIGVERHPDFAALYVNLADLQRATGREAEAEATLRRGAAVATPASAAIHQALGLSLVRQSKRDAGLDEFRRAATLAPDDVDVGFVLAIALWDAGLGAQAIAELERVRLLAPHDARVTNALSGYRGQLAGTAAPDRP